MKSSKTRNRIFLHSRVIIASKSSYHRSYDYRLLNANDADFSTFVQGGAVATDLTRKRIEEDRFRHNSDFGRLG